MFDSANPPYMFSPQGDWGSGMSEITQVGKPERPIQSVAEDQLHRLPFVSRLVDALISPVTGKANGVVIGVTGPWGSGKSSILNMLAEQIAIKYDGAHVVRFDPWLVSGRNDLITEFLRELLSTFNPGNQLQKSIIEKVSKYGALLAPVANLAAVGAGTLVESGAKTLGSLLKGSNSISALRQSLFEELSELDKPIVVLIDELDRVEDNEIRTIAQLVRSVADFPGISYVVAYDVARVTQALGAGASSSEQAERGRSYLEKIIQFAFPLPLMLRNELKALFNAEMSALQPSLGLPSGFKQIQRYKDAVDMLTRGAVATPRDIKRALGTFHVLCSAVGREVDWIELLVLSVLMGKAPRTVEMVRQNPERYVSDPVEEKEIRGLLGSNADAMVGAVSEDEKTEINSELVGYLFPRLAKSRNTLYADSLSKRRALLTALRFGLLPGDVSRDEIVELFKRSSDEIGRELLSRMQGTGFAATLDRLDEVYPDCMDLDHERVWTGIASFLRGVQQTNPNILLMRSLIGNFSAVLTNAVKREPSFKQVSPRVLLALQEADDVLLLPDIIRDQFRAHGLFNSEPDGTATLASSEMVSTLGIALCSEWRHAVLSGQLLPKLNELDAVWAIRQVGLWDRECFTAFTASLAERENFERAIVMMFGGNYTAQRASIGMLCELDQFEASVNAAIAAEPRDDELPGFRAALSKYGKH